MKHKDIRILNVLSLRGPNIWTYHPVLEAWVDIGELEECPSNTLPGFVERLCDWLPTLSEHRCSYGEPGGFIKRLQEGTWPAHILEHVTLELQNLAGLPGGFGRARETGETGVYKVVVQTRQEDVTRACLEAARDLVMAAIDNHPFDVPGTVERLQGLVREHAFGPNTACIVNAATAKDRGIPAIHLLAKRLVQLGYGASQRRMLAAMTDQTGAIAEGIAARPGLTRRLLESCGLPVADPEASPMTADHQQHRLLVVGGKLVAAARILPSADDATPPDHRDVTDHVHPATAAAACLAARVVGLNIAGVDILATDISRPLSTQDGAITSLCARPEVMMHLQTATGETRPVGRAIVDHLFPDGSCGRIPVVGITGSRGTTEVAHLVAEMLRLSGKYTGLACGDGFYLDRRRVEAGDRGDWQSGTRVLMNPSVEAAVVENGAHVILGQGMAYDRCQIGVVTRIDPEQHYGTHYIGKPEQVFQIFRSQVDVVLPDGVAVLDASDPMVADMARLCDGDVIYFSVDSDLPVVRTHRSKGGRVVFSRRGKLVFATGIEETEISKISTIPFVQGTDSGSRIDSLLAGVASAWALEIALHVIRTGVETFVYDPLTPDSHSSIADSVTE